MATPIVSTVGTQSFGYVLVTQPSATAGSVTTTQTLSNNPQYDTPGYLTVSPGSGQFSVTSGNYVSLSSTGTTGATGAGSWSSAFTFAPTVTGAAVDPLTVSYLWGANAYNGNQAGSVTAGLTLVGTGVAPVANVSSNSVVSGYYLVNSAQTATVTVTVSNTGNAYLADPTPTVKSSTYNLNGSISGGNSVFVGTAASISLQDSNFTGTGGATSATYAYTFAPTITGTNTATVVTTFTDGGGNRNSANTVTTTLSGTGVAPVVSISNSSIYGRIGSGSVSSGVVTIGNIGNANLAGTGTAFNLNGSVSGVAAGAGFASTVSGATISLASNATATTSSTATSTLGYTYTPGSSRGTSSSTFTIALSNGNSAGTNLSQSVAATVTGQAVGPTYASTLLAGNVVNTPSSYGTGTVAGAAGATIGFGSLGYQSSATVYLELANITTDPNGGNAALTNMTIDSYSISGANASAFSLSSIAGSVITEGGMLLVPITVVTPNAYGALTSSLTIFTDVGTGLGGYGENFTYALTALTVKEPASIAVLGAGLAGLAWSRRRKRGAVGQGWRSWI